MHSSNLPNIISDFKEIQIINSKSLNKKSIFNNSVELNTEEILERCCETEVRKVFSVSLRCEKLNVIPVLKEFKNLRILDLSSNKIDRINNFQYLNELKELKLFDNRIENLSGLSNLHNLVVLQVQFNMIKTLETSTFANLKKLKQLRIDNNVISEITLRHMSTCSNLTYLDISFNKLTSISFITCLPNLEEFYCTNNQIGIISDLSRCKKLCELRLSDNLIDNISGLKDHPSLSTLDLSGNKVTSLSNIGCLLQLECLNISRNQINDSDLESIATTFPILEILNLAENNLRDVDQCLSNLVKLSSLCELIIYGNPFPIINKESKQPYSPSKVAEKIPQLKLIDNFNIKKRDANSVIPQQIRPMSAIAGISLKQIENQLKGFTNEMLDIQLKTDTSYKNVLNSLVLNIPDDLRIDLTGSQEQSDRFSSLKSFRSSRLKEALMFASTNYHENDEKI